MSTNDVPGASKSNRDQLAMGCWAEQEDGSLIFIESTEGGRVIYSMFDIADEDNPVEYRDAMNVRAFKKDFSYNAKAKKSIKWTWHDKTPFPWDRIIALGSKDGVRYPSAGHLLSAAERVAKSRGLKAGRLDPDDYEHKTDQTTKGAAAAILDGLQKAIDHLRP